MNSIAQQAVPKGYGQRELFRAQLTRDAYVVVKKLSWSRLVSTSATLINFDCSTRVFGVMCGGEVKDPSFLPGGEFDLASDHHTYARFGLSQRSISSTGIPLRVL